MVRTWVSGGQSSKVVDKLRQEISDLDTKRDALIDSNKAKIFQWASSALRIGKIKEATFANDILEVIAEFDSLNQTIFDKEVLLSERLDEQAKFDSLG